MNTITRRGALRAIGAGAASLALPAFAAWPERPIKIVVSFPAGGASDIVARVLGEQLARKLGQPVVIDNRPGAGGSVGGLAVTQAAPDGYTLLLSNSTPLSIGPFALEKQPYDPVEGFTHIALIGTAPCVVMANPQTTLKTMADIEKQAKASGRLDFGSGGPASICHIYGELMRKEMNAQLVHVPYRGGAPMTTDLIAGTIPMGIDVLTAFVPYFKGGQIRPVAVTSKQRSSLVPDVPTVVEAGYAGLVLENFFGLSGPAKMSADVVGRLNGATGEVLQDAEFKKKMAELGIATQATSAAGFAAFVREQVAQLAPVVKGSGVKL
ncbi:MAG TPA: tripartite tricarboxylate transporter substrate binding protein [Variovorax sp.]|nr:tripartite tricarboxylate transporter substrate binding protein [Variovorax sp.]